MNTNTLDPAGPTHTVTRNHCLWPFCFFCYNNRAAAASARIPKELVACLKSAAPVYAANVDEVVFVNAPVPELVGDFVVESVVFKQIDVLFVISLVNVTLDALLEGTVVVLEPARMELE